MNEKSRKAMEELLSPPSEEELKRTELKSPLGDIEKAVLVAIIVSMMILGFIIGRFF